MRNRKIHVRLVTIPDPKVIIGESGREYPCDGNGRVDVAQADFSDFSFGLPGGGNRVLTPECPDGNIVFVNEPEVPDAVSMFQARLQMHRTPTKEGRSTLLADTLAATKALGPEAEIAMDCATVVRRDGDLVKAIAAQFSLTDDDLDGLFRAAAAIK